MERMTVEELMDNLNHFPDDYVIRIYKGESIGAFDENGTKRTGAAIFIDGGILLVEKPSPVDDMFEVR